ncbi:MAG: bifunctional [glutamate--ammonia ligase]-adenylyl-L-tyrosine phosphorylase/[glutamate--ammonia-ligase] adenylyltransferase [Desulfobacterales bacterium]|nr:bifunctional [glutamate--ammonia ligase]-adenylyl-L-tyrosine phosphorylase/[glutamate--ammonia-ligase] adenylyltransferase [Desulfobacterales bacterium]
MYRSYPVNFYSDKLKELLFNVKDENSLSKILRDFRRREMIRIAWRDISRTSNLFQTISELSSFADASIHETLVKLYDWECKISGIPKDSSGNPQLLVVIGMGKLGGKELNFSSDVDLIFAYPDLSYTNQEFFSRLCQKLVKILQSPTQDGIVFRVDLRLRPYGESGPIVMSFDAMEEYYHEQGREWERYALIKARVIAGDKDAGEDLLKLLKPFIYRRYLDYGAFKSLREMKHKISLEANRKSIKDDIKLGPGGIREIEFFGQVFQLIRGGINPLLQERSLLKTLEILYAENYISKDTYYELKDAYIFLRDVENRLQEFGDKQTHILPANIHERILLSESMEFSSWELFKDALDNHLKRVNYHFNQLLRPEIENEENDDDISSILISSGFQNSSEILKVIEELKSDSNDLTFNKIIPKIIKNLSSSSQPLQTVVSIIELLQTIKKRTCYISLLIENPNSIAHLVKLADLSPWIISFLTRHPATLDELLDSRTLYSPPDKNELISDLRHRISQISDNDLEHEMDVLRIFKQSSVLRVASADISGVLPLMRVSDYLTDIAETVIDEALSISWNHLIQKHGTPISIINGEKCNIGFSIVAYGKLGGIELGYNSDIDLIFLHAGNYDLTDGKDRPIEGYQFFARLGQRIVHILTTHTSAGILYDTDTRLRPSGGAGLLVTHINSFDEYQRDKAWTWEHQALVKARPICGDILISNIFNQIRKKILSIKREKNQLQQEIKQMRSKMLNNIPKKNPQLFDIKNDIGGIIDVEFLVQYLVLLYSNDYPSVMEWTDNVRIIQSLMSEKIIGENTAYILRKSYLTYRCAVHRLNLQKKNAIVSDAIFYDLKENVKRLWNIFLNNDK